jgi:hypothetical protein
MKYIVDIDGTICSQDGNNYKTAKPYMTRIHQLNKLYDEGHEIHYWTARGSSSGIDWKEYTEIQLRWWGCKFHSVNVGKPSYDVWLDDKAILLEDFFDDSDRG